MRLSELEEREEHTKHRQKRTVDRRRRARDLSQVHPGDVVWIPDRRASGTVIGETSPRSHIVSTAEGAQYQRNQQHLVQLPETETTQDTDTEIEPVEETQPPHMSNRILKQPNRYEPRWN